MADLEDMANSLSRDTEARLEAAQAEARNLVRELKAVRGDLGRALEVRDVLRDSVKAMLPPPKWAGNAGRRKKASVALLAMYSDVQMGEKTDPRQCDGWGRFNCAIAEARTQQYLDRLTRYVTVQRAGYTIDECYVVVLGDLISGDIHEELMRTNEVPPPVQAILAGRLLAALVHGLARHFKRVIVHCIGGSNHSRLTKKYQFKGGALNSYDFVAHEHAFALLAKCPTVETHHYLSKKEILNIAGFNFLCGHGDTVKAWMGIPWYGIERDLSREARRRLERIMEQQRANEPLTAGFDYGLGAHWHTPFVGPSFRYVVNGSLTGTNELDHTVGRHAPPQQVSMMVSPKHGMFAPVAWRLDTPEEEALLTVDAMDMLGGGR